MSSILQTAFAVALVTACAVYVAWQLFRTLRAGNGKAGSCCSSGCGDREVPAVTPTVREQFISSDSLRRKR